MNTQTRTLTIWVLALLTIGSPLAAAAEEAPSADDRRSLYMERRRELMELKEKDPEAFKAKVTELRNSAQKRLDDLKETDPEAYRRIIERREKRIGPRFEQFRLQNPEAFERMRHHREGLIEKRRDWMRQHDPASLERIELRRSRRVEYRSSDPANPGAPPRVQGFRREFRQEIYRPGAGPEELNEYPGDRPGPRRGGPRRQEGR